MFGVGEKRFDDYLEDVEGAEDGQAGEEEGDGLVLLPHRQHHR